MKKQKNIPELRFPGFEGEWEEKRFSKIAKFSSGKNISTKDLAKNGKIKCIRYGELYTTYSEVIDKIVSKTNIESDKLVFSQAGDIIIPKSGETNWDIAQAACIMESDIAVGGDITIIRTNENGIYLSYYINSNKRKDIAKRAQGHSVVHVYPTQLKEIFINLPVASEQQKIATFLTAVDRRIELLGKKRELLEQYKKGIMQKIFSQEIRFKDDNGNDYPDWEEKR